MDFNAFCTEERDRYAQEVREKWGKTAAFEEFQGKPPTGFEEASRRVMDLFTQMGSIKDFPPNSEKAQDLVEQLRGLGQMYTADPRFRENIDQAGGPGTAEFAGEAIAIYCDKRN